LKRREALTGYLFLAPYILFFAVFMLGPVLAAISYAFMEWELLKGTREFVGFQNFEVMFREDDLFWLSMKNSLFFSIMTTLGNTVVALSAASALKSIKIGHTLYRVAFYAPVVLSVSVISIIFQRLLSTNGLLNYGLSLLGLKGLNYLGDPNLVLPSLSITTIWWGFGFPMLIVCK
jgi:multiple sugar transport system permease protein